MSNFLKIVFFLSACLLNPINKLLAQCSGCTTTISTGVNSYTAISGQTLCLSGGITYTGTIVLNGGVVCNNGVIKNITFLKGTFQNFGTFNSGNISSNITGQLDINNYNGSNFTLGAFTFSASSSTTSLNLNIYKGASASFTSDITQNAGSFNIELGKTNPGGDPVLTSTLNASGLFTVKKDAFSLLVNTDGSCTINNIFSLEGTGVKTVTNYGNITLLRNFNFISSGSSTSTVTINNYGNLQAQQAINASYTAGKVFINNYIGTNNILNVGTALTLSNNTNTLTNTGILTVAQNFNIQKGVAINSGTLTNNSLSATGGTLTNNNLIKSNTDFLITNTLAIVNNNKSIIVANTFSNISTVNTSTQSIIYTKNYYNSGSTANILGPTSGTDTLVFPRIFISANSDNSGFVKNKIFIYDASLTSTTSNVGYGFDVVSSATRIASTIVWGSKAVAPGNGNPAQVSCRHLSSMYGVQISANPNGVICAGTPLTLTGNFGYYYYTFNQYNNPILQIATIPITGSSFNWSPGGSTGNPIVFTPLISTTYTISITYNTCVYTSTYAVTVSANTAIIAGAPVIYFAITDPIALNGSVIGGTAPYNYVWTPNNFFVNSYTNTQQNTQVSPPLSLTYTLTVTDFYGCVASTTITVIAKPYAFLNKIPDGGYYKVFNNKLLFEFDGQYAQTGLVYKVFNKTNVVIASNVSSNIANNLVVNSGDNRYYLDVSSASIPNGYYVLEVTNEKNEKFYLKFEK